MKRISAITFVYAIQAGLVPVGEFLLSEMDLHGAIEQGA
jgi:hypothetical protein